jgi:hypothetical protein
MLLGIENASREPLFVALKTKSLTELQTGKIDPTGKLGR